MRSFAASLLALCLLIGPARAETAWPGRIEIPPVQSRTLTGEELLRGGAPGREALLGDELRLPLNAPAKVPAVVLVHGFDSPTSPALVVPKAQSTRDCRLKEGLDGVTLNAATGQPYRIKTDPCVAVGAHVGHNAEATEMARAAVLRLVQQTLGD